MRPAAPHLHATRLATAVGALLLFACTQTAPLARERSRTVGWQAETWPEASALFRSDPDWLGGDGAFSVPLGGERVLWLFGDSFVAAHAGTSATSGARDRRSSVMVRNSIAVQTGLEPSQATLRFFVPRDAQGQPRSFFDAADGHWLWPGHGAIVRGSLVLFVHRMAADTQAGGLGFRPAGWSAVRIAQPEQPPSSWRVEPLAAPALSGDFGLVGASVLVEDEQVYVFSVRDPGDRALCLLRLSAHALAQGDWSLAATWSGEPRGFVAGAPCTPLLAPVATELSVSRHPRGHGYLLVESAGFGLAPIRVRTAPSLTGPWSEPDEVYRPEAPANAGPGTTLAYAAKAHPELRGADVVITYAVNSLDANRLYDDLELYFPRVLKLNTRAH